MNKTQIESVKNPDGTQGYSWNPITGCLFCTPEGLCKGGDFPCWARKLANTRLKERYLANERIAVPDDTMEKYRVEELLINAEYDPFYPRFWEDKLLPPLAMGSAGPRAKKAKGIFVCDMSDLFGIGIPEEWTKRVLSNIKNHWTDRFYLLTKQPQNLIKFSPFPDNCYVGITATNTDMAVAGMTALSEIEAKVKYVYFEPLLGYIPVTANGLSGIDWVVIGAQTKPTVYPEIGWVQKIALAATKANIPLFLKDSLKPHLPNRMPFWAVYIWKEIDKGAEILMSENRFRQEMPDESNNSR